MTTISDATLATLPNTALKARQNELFPGDKQQVLADFIYTPRYLMLSDHVIHSWPSRVLIFLHPWLHGGPILKQQFNRHIHAA